MTRQMEDTVTTTWENKDRETFFLSCLMDGVPKERPKGVFSQGGTWGEWDDEGVIVEEFITR